MSGLETFSFVAALAIGAATVYNVWKIMIAQMVVKSAEDYGNLHKDLEAIGRKFDKPENDAIFLKLCSCRTLERFLEIQEEIDFDDTDWEHAKRIKTYFRTKVYLRKSHYISRNAFILMINHWGVELLHNVVFPLERHRFFSERSNRPDSIDRHLESEFYWYSEIKCILPKYDPSILKSATILERIKRALGISMAGLNQQER